MYPEEMFEEVRRLLNKPVRVFGKAQLDATGAILRMEVRRLEEGREGGGRRSLEDLFGSDPEFTAGVDSVAYVRAHRGEQAGEQ